MKHNIISVGCVTLMRWC